MRKSCVSYRFLPTVKGLRIPGPNLCVGSCGVGRKHARAGESRILPSVSPRQYRIALYDKQDEVIEGAQYMHVSDETPTRGLPIELPQGTWFVHEVVATWSEDRSSQLLGSDPHYGRHAYLSPRSA